MKHYSAQIEVAGPIAMFARPDTGGTPTSYPIPTWSAAKGIFEAVAFLSGGDAWFHPIKLSVCQEVGRPAEEVTLQRYTTNYGGPLRKKSLFSKGIATGGSSMQVAATVATNVCFRIEAQIRGVRKKEFNPRHYLKHLFERRLKQGRCWRTPCLGWSEFTCSYWGPYRCTEVTDDSGNKGQNKLWKRYCEEAEVEFLNFTETNTGLNLDIPSMLTQVWDESVAGEYSPSFVQDAKVVAGVLNYQVPNKEAADA